MTYESLLVERRDSIVTVTMNRPDALNALNLAALQDLHAVALELAADSTLDVVIVTGAGRAFIAGADIKSMLDYSPDQAREFGEAGHRALDAFAALPVPVIAAINGFALGGGLEFALSCDLLYGSTKARLGLPEVGLGVIPGWGGTQRLQRLIGPHRARDLVFSGRHMQADEAFAIGLLLEVVEPDALLSRVNEVADAIAKNGPLAVRAAKRAMALGANQPLSTAMPHEIAAFTGLFGSADQREGMTAFVERRPAVFTRS